MQLVQSHHRGIETYLLSKVGRDAGGFGTEYIEANLM